MYLTAEQARKRATDSNNELRVLMGQIKNAANDGKLSVYTADLRHTTKNMLLELGYTVKYSIESGKTLITW